MLSNYYFLYLAVAFSWGSSVFICLLLRFGMELIRHMQHGIAWQSIGIGLRTALGIHYAGHVVQLVEDVEAVEHPRQPALQHGARETRVPYQVVRIHGAALIATTAQFLNVKVDACCPIAHEAGLDNILSRLLGNLHLVETGCGHFLWTLRTVCMHDNRQGKALQGIWQKKSRFSKEKRDLYDRQSRSFFSYLCESRYNIFRNEITSNNEPDEKQACQIEWLGTSLTELGDAGICT